MAKQRVRVKRTEVAVPSSIREADNFVARIGETQKDIDRLEAQVAEKIAEVKALASAALDSLKTKRRNLLNGLFSFASARKDELTVERKTVCLSSGKFLWRLTPPAVKTDGDGVAIETLHDLGYDEYIRIKEELDREALLADRNSINIPGIDFTQKEEFVVVPKDTKEVVKTRTIKLE